MERDHLADHSIDQELIAAPPMDACLVTLEEMIPTKELEGKYRVWTRVFEGAIVCLSNIKDKDLSRGTYESNVIHTGNIRQSFFH